MKAREERKKIRARTARKKRKARKKHRRQGTEACKARAHVRHVGT